VIDHLGTVSSKFEHKMEEKTEITQMEEKLNLLKQVTFFSLEKNSLTDRNVSPVGEDRDHSDLAFMLECFSRFMSLLIFLSMASAQ
jgi:hypothetical protein